MVQQKQQQDALKLTMQAADGYEANYNSHVKFLNSFMLITFAYYFVKFYDSTIPGIGYSLKSFISQGTTNLAQSIGQDSISGMLKQIDTAVSKSGTSMAALTAPYLFICYILSQIMLCTLAAVVAVILGYGAIAGTIIGILGPIFIPFLVFDKLEFLFWGWLKATNAVFARSLQERNRKYSIPTLICTKIGV
jgi:type IV secretory pathway VirB6-like protein